MLKRFKFAKSAGCDGIEPDNVGAYTVSTTGPFQTQVCQLDFVLCNLGCMHWAQPLNPCFRRERQVNHSLNIKH